MADNIFFEITDRCNQLCSHCCKTWRNDSGYTMDKDLLDKIISLPKKLLTISGGEPGLVPDKVKYIIDNVTSQLQINTNLTLWTDEMFNLFRQKNIMLSISVVSLNRETYRKITHTDLVDRLKANLNKVSKDSKITIIVNEYNLLELENMVDQLIVQGFHNFVIQPAIPNNAKFNAELFNKEMDAVYNVYSKHRNVDISLMSMFNPAPKLPINHLCDAGNNRLVILSNGDVVPCACMKPHILGNIMRNDWSDIEKRGIAYYNSFHGNKQYLCKGFLDIPNIDKQISSLNFGASLDDKISVAYVPKCFSNIQTVLQYVGFHNKRYLDLGAGIGMLYEFLPSNVEYKGIDLLPQQNKLIEIADIREAINNIPISYYDCIVASGIFRFVQDKYEFLNILRSILKLKPKKFICLQNFYGIARKDVLTIEDILFVKNEYNITWINDRKYSYFLDSIIKNKGFYLKRRE